MIYSQVDKRSPEAELIALRAEVDPAKRRITDRLIFDALRLGAATEGHCHEISTLGAKDCFQLSDIWNHAKQIFVGISLGIVRGCDLQVEVAIASPTTNHERRSLELDRKTLTRAFQGRTFDLDRGGRAHMNSQVASHFFIGRVRRRWKGLQRDAG